MNGQLLIRNSHPVLCGHLVQGEKVLPGLGYIDLLYQYFRKHGHDFTRLELRNLAIHRPMVLPEQQDMLLEVSCAERSPGIWHIEVNGTLRLGTTPRAEARRYATAQMHSVAPVELTPFDCAAIKSAAKRTANAEDIFAEIRRIGVLHSGLMKAHGVGYATDTDVCAEIHLDPAYAGSDGAYMFNPGLVDSGVVCSSAMLPKGAGAEDRDHSLLVPLFYESFRASALLQRACTTRISIASFTPRKELCSFTVEFFDAAGTKVALLTNLGLKSLRLPDAIAVARTKALTAQRESAALAAQSPSMQQAAPRPAFAAGASQSQQVAQLLRSLLAQQLRVNHAEIQETIGYYEMGLDSAGLLELVQILERRLGCALAPTLLFEYTTIAELSEYLVQNFGTTLLAGEPATQCAAQPPPATSNVAAVQPVSATPVLRAEPVRSEIAIIGMAARLPGSSNIRELWNNLLAAKDCITEVPASRWDWQLIDQVKSASGKPMSRWGGFLDDFNCFDAQFFRISPRDAEVMDPQERLFLEVCWEAIEDAGHTPKTLAVPRGPSKRRDVGVFAGAMHKDYMLLQGQQLQQGNLVAMSLSNASIANRVSYYCGFHGPSVAIDTLCSASLSAVHFAIESLQHGSCEVALAGGVNLSLHPGKYLTYGLADMHASDGRCRSFGKGGDGYVAAEGVGAVVLKPLAQAEADGDHIYAVIKASAVNHVGTVSGISVPSPVAQADLIAHCLDAAHLDARSIGCIEAHGTGTSLGDPIEIDGLTKAFRRHTADTHFCALSSLKSNIGHAESAAGIGGLIKLALQLQQRTLVPALHAAELNPYVDWERSPFVVPQRAEPWQPYSTQAAGREVELPRRGAVSSFGAAGSNAHVILEEHAAQPRAAVFGKADGPQVVLLSARNAARLQVYAQRLLQYLENYDADLMRLAYTLQVGREALDARVAFLAVSCEELTNSLRRFLGLEQTASREYFVGELKQHKDTIGLLASDEDSSELLEKWLAKGKVAKLAELWVKGFEVPWARLYTGTPRRMSLPTYPFARQVHWLEQPRAVAGTESGQALHPMLHQNTSDLAAMRFSSVFSGAEFYLSDHVVKGAKVLPGVAYLEMAHAAVSRALSETRDVAITLRHVVWSQPIAVSTAPRTVHVELYGDAAGEIGYEVYSEAEQGRVIHAQGAASRSPQPATAALDLDELRRRSPRALDVSACYELLTASGLAYGPALRAMHAVNVGTDAAGEPFVLAELRLPAVIERGSAAYVLHPSVVDSALQASIGLILAAADAQPNAGTQQLQPYLPYGLESLQVFAACPRVAYAVIRNGVGGGPRLRKLAVTICDGDGKVCVQLHGFAARLLEGEIAPGQVTRSDAQPQPIATFTERWEPQLLANSDLRVLQRMVCVVSTVQEQQAITALVQQHSPATQLRFLMRAPTVSLAAALQALVAAAGAPDAVVSLWGPEAARSASDALDIVALLQGLASAGLHGTRVLLAGCYTSELERCYVESWQGFVHSLQRTAGYRLSVCGLAGEGAVAAQLEQAAARLWHELHAASAQAALYVGNQRLVSRLYPTARAAHPTVLRQGGTYLITGGLGALGLALAAHLLRTYSAKLILIGRSAGDVNTQARLAALPGNQAQVCYLSAEVSDATALRSALLAAREQFGSLHGVFHLAGCAASTSVFTTDSATFAAVLAPKIGGTLALDAALAGESLDFVCYFSSTAAVLGDFGACAYAVANRFQMAYARSRAGRTVAINWPLWAEGAMRVGNAAQTDAYLASSGQRALGSAEGLTLLEHLLAEPLAQQLVLAGYPAALRQLLGIAPTASKPAAPAVRGAEANAQLEQQMVRHLQRLLAGALKLPTDAVATDEPFEGYGIDSILVMQLTNELEKSFGSLSKTLFFEHPTIEALSRYFLEAHAAHAARLFGSNAPPSAALMAQPAEAARQRRQPTRPTQLPAPHEVPALQPIAIIGLSGRFPQAADVEQFWENIKAGKDCISEVPTERWDVAAYYATERSELAGSCCKWGGFISGVDEFDPLFFQLSPAEAQFIDPQQRLYLETVWSLLEGSGYTREALQERYQGRVGVYVGSMYNQYDAIEGDAAVSALSSSPPAAIANRVSHFFGLQGPSVVLDTMCSSAAMALHTACNDLRAGLCELAIAGGVNLTLHPKKYLSLSRAELLSSNPRGRSFGESDGYLPAEAVGAVLLKPLAQAASDGDEVWGLIRATAVNHNGRSTGYSVPNPTAQAQVMQQVLDLAGVTPQSVSYVEAAASGLALGDAIEVAALKTVFAAAGTRPIGAVKSNIGHAEAASMMSQLTKVLLQMKHAMLAPSIMAERLNPDICFAGSGCELQRELSSWAPTPAAPRRALINSFGAGGSNVSVLIEEYLPTPAPQAPTASGPHVMLLSAREPTALQTVVANLLQHLRRYPQLDLAALAYTLQVGREAMGCRLALLVSNHAELLAGLEAFLAPQPAAVLCTVPSFVGSPSDSQPISAFTSGSGGRALLETFLRAGDLEKLALFWTKGGKVPWAAMYDAARPRLLRLPTYPFTRARYWVARLPAAPRSATAPLALADLAPHSSSAPALHPLLHANTSDFEEYRFSSNFSGTEPFAWRDLTRAAQVLPESIYLEMPCAAVQRAMGRTSSMREGVRLRGLEWLAPLYLTSAAPTLHIALRPDESELIAYEIYVAPSEPAERLVYSRGYAMLVPPTNVLPNLDLPALRARCSSSLSAAQWYETLRRLSFEAGAGYGDAGSIARGVAENGSPFVLVELELPQQAEQANCYRLHPILLSLVLQAAATLIDEGGASDGRAALTGWCAAELLALAPLPARAIAHIYLSAADSASVARSVDIDFYDTSGVHLGQLQRLQRLAQGRGIALPPRVRRDDLVPPRSELETALRDIWAEVLGFDAIGVLDNFMELGGNSLSAARVVARIRDVYQVEIPSVALLAAPGTIVQLTQAIVRELARQVAAERAT